ncbi:hypothetical protein [Methylobacterium nodulans]|uniref:hypothetical protein n=1 Tax=Methylobacterium nodulans TaxID=114616 RepID=UPI000161672E|nr:hypothetical protein [Methylobacterium nodulans]
MPAVIAPVIASALASTALSSTAVFAVSQIVSYALVAGASLALQMALQPGQQKQKVSSQQYQLKQALPPLIAGYGLDKLGGAKFAFEAPGGWYLDGIVHGVGPWDGIETWLLNDIPTGIPKDQAYNGALGGLNQPAPMMGNAAVETHLGTLPTQARSQTLATLLGWDETRRLDGLAYTVLTLKPVAEKNFNKVYSQGAPQVYAVARLLRTWDPRDAGQTGGAVLQPRCAAEQAGDFIGTEHHRQTLGRADGGEPVAEADPAEGDAKEEAQG